MIVTSQEVTIIPDSYVRPIVNNIIMSNSRECQWGSLAAACRL